MYKITIEKIWEKEVGTREYKVIWENKETWESEWGYVEIPNIKTVTISIYEQTIDKDEFDIKKVIDAFNQ